MAARTMPLFLPIIRVCLPSFLDVFLVVPQIKNICLHRSGGDTVANSKDTSSLRYACSGCVPLLADRNSYLWWNGSRAPPAHLVCAEIGRFHSRAGSPALANGHTVN